MKDKKKGSALIMVLALTIFIMGILGALFIFATSTIKQVNSYNNINSTYYASESCFQNVTVNMVKNNNYKFTFSTTPSLTDNSHDSLQNALNTQLNNYKTGKIEDKTSGMIYELNQNGNIPFVNDKSSTSYYEIKDLYFNNDVNCSGDDLGKTTLVKNSDSTWTYTVPIVLDCNGGVKSKRINSNASKEQKYKFWIIFTIYESDGHYNDTNKTPYYFFKASDSPEIKLDEKVNNTQ